MGDILWQTAMNEPSTSQPQGPRLTENDQLFDELLENIVYVGNLPKNIMLTDLIELFKYAGRIERVAWYGEHRTDINTKVAFVRFRHSRHAKEAAKWDRIRYHDSILIVMQIFKDQWFDMSVSIMVRNIRDDTTDWQLYEAFRRFGKIYGILIPTHGTAYVGFYYEAETQCALEMNNNMFNGNRMRVEMLRRNLPLQQIDIFDMSRNEVRLLRDMLLEVDEKLEQFYSAYDEAFNYSSKDYRRWKRKRRRVTPLLSDSSSSSESSSSSVSELSNRSANEVRRILCGSNEENRCLGIFGMNPDTTEKTLMKLFSRYGHVKDIKLIYDGKTNVSRGYSFIYFKHASDARRAQRKLNGTMLEGRKVRVDFSRSKPHEPRADRRKRVSPTATAATAASTSADRCCHRRHGTTHHKKRKKRRVCYSSSDSE
ncbi:ELAV-like protein 4 [Anopheles marshallii]|uniref:ELAV-like protein 4 n=1 Tax=Anopheles marshallii TaxID=1521116 RepID=UPI00237BC7B6|nr:ELAV-like protein 4 [Anopheles marshallii]